MYQEYLLRLSRKVSARLDEIEANYNFDYGDEFEIALCDLLADILPNRYGVCRGFLVSPEGKKAGDDIIVYDRMRFPTLRSSISNSYALKEEIPIEAVLTYIECKHTLHVVDEKGNPENLFTAIHQVRNAKQLISTRQPKENIEYSEDVTWRGVVRDWPHQHPPLKNPPFGIIMSRTAGPSTTVESINKSKIIGSNSPDLIIAGNDIIVTPSANLGPDGIKSTLYYDEKFNHPLLADKAENMAYGLGLATLMAALEWIELLPINWASALNAGFWKSTFNSAT